MRTSIAVITAIAGLCLTIPAAAATYAIHYAAVTGTFLPTKTFLPTVADLRIVTANHLNAIGGYDILSASGTVNGIAIDGLAPVNPPGFNTNNVFFKGTPVFDLFGLGWTSAGTTGNLYFFGGAYQLHQYDPLSPNGLRRFNRTSGDIAVAAVPEPASWAMLIVGFAAVGIVSRRRKIPGTKAKRVSLYHG